jgi:hypothetical protein
MNVGGLGQVEILGELRRLRAEHYRIQAIAEFINCGGNALPLRE